MLEDREKLSHTQKMNKTGFLFGPPNKLFITVLRKMENGREV